jgi:hypothetical protein
MCSTLVTRHSPLPQHTGIGANSFHFSRKSPFHLSALFQTTCALFQKEYFANSFRNNRFRTLSQNTRVVQLRQSSAANHCSLFSTTTHYPLLTFFPLKPMYLMAHPYLCTRKKGPAAREPRY